METFDRLTPQESRLHGRRFRLACGIAVIGILGLLAFFNAFASNRPVDYESDEDHFYYGSIGSDISGGLPLKVMQVLPAMFPEYLPTGAERHDYTVFGFIQEPGAKMPIGFSIRQQFIDLTSINCGVCHTGSVRETVDSEPVIIPAMPANTMDLLAFFEFLFDCAGDQRFNSEEILAAMEKADISGPLDGLIYRFVIPRMKEGLLARSKKISFLFEPDYPRFGPGRVNTFDTFKYDQFAYYYQAHGQEIDPDEIYGTVALPSIWNQAAREGLKLHWDGNNSSVRERNFSAAIGAGAKPQDMDIERMFRIERWLATLPPPAYPFSIDEKKAKQGEAIYKKYCLDCHDFTGKQVGQVFPLAKIGTDRHRLDSYTQFLLEAQQDYTEGYFWSFTHFTKTHGYASQPLDGIWARAPYLHNGSVPTMWDLLTPAEERPQAFTIGGDVYDQEKMGFVHEALTGSPESGYIRNDGSSYTGTAFVLDTNLRSNSSQGHTGPAYGTELSDDQKRALIEYFKWQDRPSGRPVQTSGE
ncbi:MAG: cytochrome c [Acidiferrobacterales bacterium]